MSPTASKDKEESVTEIEEVKEVKPVKEIKPTPAPKTARELALEEKAKQEAAMNERVKIRLIKDSGDYKNDVEVCWNGKVFQIQRGVDVMVPMGVEEILRSSEHQDMIASAMQERLVGKDVYLGER